MSCNPSATSGITSSHASGAPSEPCRGASARRFKTERIDPIGLTRIFLGLVLLFVVDFTTASRIDVAAENDRQASQTGRSLFRASQRNITMIGFPLKVSLQKSC